MSLYSRSRVVLLLAITLQAAACGFQFQGAFTAPQGMERTYLAADDTRTQFYRELRSALMASGVAVVDAPDQATAVFAITFDETDQRVLSVSARNVPTEFEVYYTVQYSINAGTQNLLEQQTLTLTRDYTYDSTLVLGKAREEELLRDAIVQDLVRVVLKQIATL